MRLAGKVALVTGGGTGIGAATARRFVAEGARVVVTGRRAAPIEALARELDSLAVAGDAARAADVREAVAAARERYGRLDVVVANAGGEGGAAVGELDDAGWQASFDSNLTSAFVCCREALPSLLEHGGAIVIVSSAAGLAAVPGLAAYTTMKTGLIGLTRSLAVDYGPRRVRTNAVCPGWVRTPMADREMDALAEARGLTRAGAYELATAHVPLGRPADAEEIAAVCLFLASDEASYLNGAILPIDGGMSAVDVGTLAFAGDA